MATLNLTDLEPFTQKYKLDFEDFVVSELGLCYNGGKHPDYKSGVCRLFLKGNCPRGSHCKFRHAKGPRLTVCKHYYRSLCQKGDKCDFLHEIDRSRMPTCHFWSSHGYCANGNKCAFLHVDPNAEVQECAWYARGFCRHGPRCRNKHVRRAMCQNYLTGFCPLGPDCEHAHPKGDGTNSAIQASDSARGAMGLTGNNRPGRAAPGRQLSDFHTRLPQRTRHWDSPDEANMPMDSGAGSGNNRSAGGPMRMNMPMMPNFQFGAQFPAPFQNNLGRFPPNEHAIHAQQLWWPTKTASEPSASPYIRGYLFQMRRQRTLRQRLPWPTG
ncbi:Cleavage and polyadenylation specificity factor subunit 4 [Dimargaris xerosporica]|nr:Cleavage and polyadenylation specificity factor subunit 4 [Dimargaris xerosporica]